MSRAKFMRLKIDGKRLVFKRGNSPSTDLSQIEKWNCPTCKKRTGKAKCIISHIQYGFEWDNHLDYFRCECGTCYYAEYNVWLVKTENVS